MRNINQIRQTALTANSKYYFDDTPCRNGHPAPVKRTTKGRWCYICHLEDNKRRYKVKKEQALLVR